MPLKSNAQVHPLESILIQLINLGANQEKLLSVKSTRHESWSLAVPPRKLVFNPDTVKSPQNLMIQILAANFHDLPKTPLLPFEGPTMNYVAHDWY